MTNDDIKDNVFRDAVEAIDRGDLSILQGLIHDHPRLLSQPLEYPQEGYFKDPFLIYFIADNPIRIPRVSGAVVDITRFLIQSLKKAMVKNASEQIDYTFGLVVTGRITRECGVQMPLIDLLVAEGVKPGGVVSALANKNIEAAKRLVGLGASAPLAAVMELASGRISKSIIDGASSTEIQVALMVAAFYGNVENIILLLGLGADPNAFIEADSGFHSHATPLHQAVSSGSIDAVRVLVENGADLTLTDRIYHGTPVGWASHMANDTEETSDIVREKYRTIEKYLLEAEAASSR